MSSQEMEIEFLRWIRNAGGFVHEALDLFHPAEGREDRSVVAKENIQKGQQLLLIPNKLTLHLTLSNEASWMDSEHHMEVKNILQKTEGLTPFLTTLLMLLAEMTRGKESEFHPYIQTLPNSAPPALLAWSEEDLTLLKGTTLQRNRDSECFRELYDKYIEPLMKQYPHFWSPEFQEFNLVLRIAGIVQSRVFHLKEENWITNKVHEGSTLYLLPAIDMLNHAADQTSANTELIKIQDQMTVQLDDNKTVTIDGYFAMKAERDIIKGEEILHSYGDLSDGALLRIYGFIPPTTTGRNQHNFLEVKYSTLKAACLSVLQQHHWLVEKMPDRENFLETHLMVDVKETEFHLMMDELLPDHLVSILQVMLLPEEEFQDLLSNYHGQGRDDFLLGVDFMDETDWTELVILALLEVVKAKELEMDWKDLEVISNAKHRMVKVVQEGEWNLLQSFKTAVLELMSINPDDEIMDPENEAKKF